MMFEIEAIRMISRYLPVAVDEPQNPEGRNGMAVAQYIAGMALLQRRPRTAPWHGPSHGFTF